MQINNNLPIYNTSFQGINAQKILPKTKNIAKTKALDTFVKSKPAIEKSQNSFSKFILDKIRDNPINTFGAIILMSLAGVLPGGRLFSLGACALALTNLFINMPPRAVFQHDKTIIDPVRDKNLTKNQKLCKSIFLANFSEEEANLIKQKYKDLLKIKDKDEFINAVFNALREDYRLNNIPIKLKTSSAPDSVGGKYGTVAQMLADYDNGEFIISTSRFYDKEKFLTSLTHEMHHIKQHIIGYVGAESYNELRLNRAVQLMEEKNISPLGAAISAESFVQAQSRVMSSLGYEINSLPKDSPWYDYARKIVKDDSKYALKSRSSYRNSFKEIDSLRAQKMITELVK